MTTRELRKIASEMGRPAIIKALRKNAASWGLESDFSSVRFPESGRSECTYRGRSDCRLVAGGGRPLTVNLKVLAI